MDPQHQVFRLLTFVQCRGKHQSFEEALHQKEAEKQLIYSEMMQSKQRQEVLEQRMSKMVNVLVRACHSIG